MRERMNLIQASPKVNDQDLKGESFKTCVSAISSQPKVGSLTLRFRRSLLLYPPETSEDPGWDSPASREVAARTASAQLISSSPPHPSKRPSKADVGAASNSSTPRRMSSQDQVANPISPWNAFVNSLIEPCIGDMYISTPATSSQEEEDSLEERGCLPSPASSHFTGAQ